MFGGIPDGVKSTMFGTIFNFLSMKNEDVAMIAFSNSVCKFPDFLKSVIEILFNSHEVIDGFRSS